MDHPIKILSNVDVVLLDHKWKNCYLEASTYARRNRIALTIMQDDGKFIDVIAVATVNMPSHPCEKDEVYVKDWSENAGMTDFLINNHIIKPEVINYVTSGYVHVSRYKLTPHIWNKVQYLIEE